LSNVPLLYYSISIIDRKAGEYMKTLIKICLVPFLFGIGSIQYVTAELNMNDQQVQIKLYHKAGAPELYPEHLRTEIDQLNDVIFYEVSNGV